MSEEVMTYITPDDQSTLRFTRHRWSVKRVLALPVHPYATALPLPGPGALRRLARLISVKDHGFVVAIASNHLLHGLDYLHACEKTQASVRVVDIGDLTEGAMQFVVARLNRIGRRMKKADRISAAVAFFDSSAGTLTMEQASKVCGIPYDIAYRFFGAANVDRASVTI